MALIALIAAVAIGYAVEAARDSGPAHPTAVATRSGPSPSGSTASGSTNPGSTRSGTLAAVDLSALPVQAVQTYDLIQRGGPFPYSQDGVVFDNNEHLLPAHPRGYYHEYTVPTPGSDDRGARRIVRGNGGEYYYTSDHYESFRRITVDR